MPTCDSAAGCVAVNAYCFGTPVACETLPVAQCAQNMGCSVAP
jgi:hypothetical protein